MCYNRQIKKSSLPICPMNSILIPWCSNFPLFFKVTFTCREQAKMNKSNSLVFATIVKNLYMKLLGKKNY